MDAKVLPHIHKPYDIPIVLTDQLFNDDGTLVYDFFNHDGRIGDVFCVNGVAQPKFHVQRRKYRFRLLNASNARIYHLRLSTGQPFLVCGTDSWLLPEARPLKSFTLAMANRQDLIVDFSGYTAGTEVYLENIMEQRSGRKPEQINPAKPVPLLKFIVTGGYVPNDVTIGPGTLLRPHEPIHADELVGGTRTFTFNRSHGAWTINNTFFSPRRADAVPALISGIPDGYDVHQDLRFELLGDVQRLEGRGVGFPEFEPGGETMPPLP